MSTDAKRRGNAASHKRREEAGLKKATYWLTPETQAKLDQIKATSGLSANEVINRAIAGFDPTA